MFLVKHVKVWYLVNFKQIMLLIITFTVYARYSKGNIYTWWKSWSSLQMQILKFIHRDICYHRCFCKNDPRSKYFWKWYCLDLACLTGYSTAIISNLVATVIGVEPLTYVEKANKILSDLQIDNAAVLLGDISQGWVPRTL